MINFGGIITTYRCNSKCHFCNIWKYPSNIKEEIKVESYEKLPFIKTVNITGGEPFLREDLDDIVRIIKKKSNRIIISSNGLDTEKITKFFDKHRNVGIRISIEGLPRINDSIRGQNHNFDNSMRTLLELSLRKIKDIGIAITISNRNICDLTLICQLANMMKIDFSTAVPHNSFYFHKYDNEISNTGIMRDEIKKIILMLLGTKRIKNWFRAYFNYGLINFIHGKSRLIRCEMGYNSFFLDPYGEVFPCNVMQKSMGNIKDDSFDVIWKSKQADNIRECVRQCTNNCWMICNAGQQIKKIIWKPSWWIIKHKFLNKKIPI